MRDRDSLDVTAVVDACINDNLWHIEHFDTRLDDYYGTPGAKRARAVLDFVAQSTQPVTIEAIKAHLNIDHPEWKLTRDDLLELLDKLEKDHYLVRENDADRMSSVLLARIWRHRRRLK